MAQKFSLGAPSSYGNVPMFSQSPGQIPFDSTLDQSTQLYSAPTTPNIGDWASGAAPKYGTPSFMQEGFMPSNPAESMTWQDSLKDAFGTPQSPGWATGLLGAGQGLMNGWLGMQQYGLAKDKLAEGKRQFELNYNAQRTMTNADLEDRQKARVASNPGAYESVGSYMSKNGVKGLA